jgi:rSAM/selenodomain-associated transferase 1
MIQRSVKLDDRCLLFFVKNPVKGKVKSRLAAVIGEDSAVYLYKNLVAQMLATLKKGTFPLYVCFFPKNAQKLTKNWLGTEYRYVPQNGKDLGERMRNGFTGAFQMGFKRVVLIGSDIPDLPLGFIREAFASLREKDVVIGPAYDGGYYLIGFRDKTFSPQVFEGIAWGTKNVFYETIKKLKGLRRAIHALPYQRDIDTAEDFKYLKETFLSPAHEPSEEES